MNEEQDILKQAMESEPLGEPGKYKCPVCHSDLHEIAQSNGPDDVDITGVACPKCKYRYDN